MHMISSLSYWAAIIMLVSGVLFIGFIEFFSLFRKEEVTISTIGWKGIVPSILLLSLIFFAITSSLSTLVSVWLP